MRTLIMLSLFLFSANAFADKVTVPGDPKPAFDKCKADAQATRKTAQAACPTHPPAAHTDCLSQADAVHASTVAACKSIYTAADTVYKAKVKEVNKLYDADIALCKGKPQAEKKVCEDAVKAKYNPYKG